MSLNRCDGQTLTNANEMDALAQQPRKFLFMFHRMFPLTNRLLNDLGIVLL